MPSNNEVDTSLIIYVDKLVRSMPKWIQDTFESGRCEFKLDEKGYLSLQLKRGIPKLFKQNIIKKVRKYLDENKIVELSPEDLN